MGSLVPAKTTSLMHLCDHLDLSGFTCVQMLNRDSLQLQHSHLYTGTGNITCTGHQSLLVSINHTTPWGSGVLHEIFRALCKDLKAVRRLKG